MLYSSWESICCPINWDSSRRLWFPTPPLPILPKLFIYWHTQRGIEKVEGSAHTWDKWPQGLWPSEVSAGSPKDSKGSVFSLSVTSAMYAIPNRNLAIYLKFRVKLHKCLKRYETSLVTSSIQFSCSVMQHARPPCPSPTPRACSNSCPSSRWCHPTISSSVVPFPSCLQSFSASGSFQMSQFFSSGGQSIGASASASVLPINIRDWFPLGLTGLISLQSKGLSRVFSKTTAQKHQFFSAQLSLWFNSHICTWPLEKP